MTDSPTSHKAARALARAMTNQPSLVSDTCLIVEWDIPAKPHGPQQRFYYHLKKLLRAHDNNAEMSTRSVLITDNEELAREVWELAKTYGKSHLYKAWPIK